MVIILFGHYHLGSLRENADAKDLRVNFARWSLTETKTLKKLKSDAVAEQQSTFFGWNEPRGANKSELVSLKISTSRNMTDGMFCL